VVNGEAGASARGSAGEVTQGRGAPTVLGGVATRDGMPVAATADGDLPGPVEDPGPPPVTDAGQPR
jgi:hypothetical protein